MSARAVGRWEVSWAQPDGVLRAVEPTAAELAAAAPDLVRYYNDAHNAAMMAHEHALASEDVLEHFERVRADGGRAFLLLRDGVLMGDADLRHVHDARAEFAILIGARGEQGRGTGTRFAAALHTLAFGALGLRRVYVTIIPANAGSLRLFEKLGYTADDGPEARAFTDEPADLSFSLGRDTFAARWTEALRDVRAEPRPPDAAT